MWVDRRLGLEMAFNSSNIMRVVTVIAIFLVATLYLSVADAGHDEPRLIVIGDSISTTHESWPNYLRQMAPVAVGTTSPERATSECRRRSLCALSRWPPWKSLAIRRLRLVSRNRTRDCGPWSHHRPSTPEGPRDGWVGLDFTRRLGDYSIER